MFTADYKNIHQYLLKRNNTLTEEQKKGVSFYTDLWPFEGKMSINCDAIDALKSLTSSSDKKTIASVLFDYLEVKEESPEAVLCQSGITLDKELIETLSKIQKSDTWEEAVRKKAEEYLENAWKRELSHKERRKNLDKAIKLLQRFREEKEGISPETLIVLARAYLRRSQIIRPKGLTTPAKKKEAIEKGIKIANGAINAATTEDNKQKAYRIRGLLYVEKERILEGDERLKEILLKEIKNALEESIKNGCNKFKDLEDDVKIAVLYCELCKELNKESCNNEILQDIINSKAKDIELEKARAYRLLNNEKGIEEKLNTLIDQRLQKNGQYIPFSAPIWDDTVRFLVKLYENNNNDLWKKFSIKLWCVCKEIEERVPFTLHIRWYWSRMRDLYDLAFLAAGDDYRLKAEIADSLKSRPAVKWNVLEELAGGDDRISKWIKKLYEVEAEAFTGRYIVEYKKLRKEYEKIMGEKFTPPETPDIENDVPKDWIVIHFYLNHLEKRENKGKGGYALIYDKDLRTWDEKAFEFNDLFHAYMTWQTDYNRNKEKASGSLEKLCMVIGEQMPFLFELSEDERPVLFIPHDFLHRLPLHGAIKIGNGKPTVFLEKHPSCYLPAWGMTGGKRSEDTLGDSLLLKNFEYSFTELKNKFKSCFIDPFKGRVIDPAKPDDLQEITSPPKVLIILCHGKADMVNPFNSRLELNKGDATHLQILKNINLKGSVVFLGACETELVPPFFSPPDEHLSLTSAFMINGAFCIVGVLWEVSAGDVDRVFARFLNNKNFDKLNKELKAWQYNELFKNGKLKKGDFYWIIPFRIVGLPEIH